MSDRHLRLERPLVSFDLETTGLDIREDRIVEISCVKLMPSGEREIFTKRLNPQRPIAADASRVHGIYDADVADAPTFNDVAAELVRFFEGCDLTGFNLERFDVPILVQEFKRAGISFPNGPTRVIDSQQIFFQKEPRTLVAAYAFYCGKSLDNAHSAEADAIAAAEVLMAQVERYTDMPTEVGDLHDFCHPHNPDWIDASGKLQWQDGQAVIGFGKHRNKSLEMLAKSERGYLEWIVGADFPEDVTHVIRDALDGKFPERAGEA